MYSGCNQACTYHRLHGLAHLIFLFDLFDKQTNKNLRCGNRKGLLGRNDQTHHRMGPKTMDATPPIKRNTQAYIQLPRLQTVRRKQIRHQEERDGSKANTMQSTNQARCPVSPPHLYHPKCPEHHPRFVCNVLGVPSITRKHPLSSPAVPGENIFFSFSQLTSAIAPQSMSYKCLKRTCRTCN